MGEHNEFGAVHNNDSLLLENQYTLVRNFQRMLRETQTNTSNYLIKQLPKATAFIDKEFKVIHVSDTWIEYFDFNPNRVIGQTIHKLFGKVSPEWQEALQNSLRGKQSEVEIERFFDCDSNEKWFEWVNIPWYDEKENVIGVILQIEDITKRIRSELEHDKLQILLREKSEIAKIGTWEYDAVTDILTWSEMTKKIHEVPMDYKPDISKGIDFYKEGYSKNTISLAIHKAMVDGIPWNEKLQLVTAKGNEIWIIAAGKPLFKNGEFIGLIGTFQDVNENVVTDIKTKENEKLLRTLIDNLPLNVFIKDLESRKILANKSEVKFCGLEHESEIIGKDDFEFYDKATATSSREEDVFVMQTLTPILGKEAINVKKNGETTVFMTSKLPLIGDDGKANGLVGISWDISNLKQKEKELRDLINVTSLQNKQLINFAHIVSHNLRSHTANFSMLLEFLINESDEKEKEKIIGMLTEASDNLLETLDNLNEVVAISTNVNLEKKPVVLNKKIATVEQNLAAFLKKNNALIINEISDDVKIRVIPAYIDSILMNFITNSVKYKDPQRDPVIRLSVKRNDHHTILSIEDNGLGIDLKKYGEKLFGMYKTFHHNSDARGIGLYISKNQIEAMNGKVMVCSEVGKGTTFNIYFNEKD
ncbi:MAG: PAS domain-containing protein [Flavobacteriaceae bacterium]